MKEHITTLSEFNARYTQQVKIGEGGFGKVYKAYDTVDDEWVAIKIAEVKDGKNEKYRLANEVEKAAKLGSHTHIANYKKCYTFQVGHVMFDYAIMQYYPLGSLDQFLDSHNVSETQKGDILKGILAGLKILHENTTLHRDLKPQNVLVVKRNDGSIIAKISDFGISRSFGAQWSGVNSLTGGTIGFCSPEQLQGREDLYPSSDLWSLGCIIYRLFKGKSLFKSESISSESDRVKIIKEITEGVLPDDMQSMPEPYFTLIKECLIVNPDNRIQTVAECQVMLGYGKKADPQSSSIGNGQKTPSPDEVNGKKKEPLINWLVALHEVKKKLSNRYAYAVLALIPLIFTIWWVYNSLTPVTEPDDFAKQGYQFNTGLGSVKIDEKKGFEMYKISAEKGNPFGQVRLAGYYIQGMSMLGIQKDSLKAVLLVSKAFEDLKKAANHGQPLAQHFMGLIYQSGLTVEKDTKKAIEWYQKAANQGLPTAQLVIGLYYNDINDDKQAIEWLKKAANQGLASAQFHLGWNYWYGRGTDKDVNKAIELLQKAADKGLADAQDMLGTKYQLGDGIDKDVNKAVEWFTKASNQGLSDGQYHLGLNYYSGDGVTRDVKKAVELWHKAADQEYVIAQCRLGLSYSSGDGVEKDPKKAIEWWQKAANKGYPEAQTALGMCHYTGIGVDRDIKKAIEWWQKAADQGYPEAQVTLGHCYQVGEGVSKDIGKAKLLYQEAARNGYRLADAALDELSKQNVSNSPTTSAKQPALTQKPTKTLSYDRYRLIVCLRDAKAYLDADETESAQNILKVAIGVPNVPNVIRDKIAEAYYKVNQKAVAMKIIERLINDEQKN